MTGWLIWAHLQDPDSFLQAKIQTQVLEFNKLEFVVAGHASLFIWSETTRSI